MTGNAKSAKKQRSFKKIKNTPLMRRLTWYLPITDCLALQFIDIAMLRARTGLEHLKMYYLFHFTKTRYVQRYFNQVT
jgi:hypothetical protein